MPFPPRVPITADYPSLPAHALAVRASSAGGIAQAVTVAQTLSSGSVARTTVDVAIIDGMGAASVYGAAGAPATLLPLIRVDTPWGGWRWRWVCSVTSERVGSVYLMDGCWASRQAHGMTWASSRRVHPARLRQRWALAQAKAKQRAGAAWRPPAELQDLGLRTEFVDLGDGLARCEFEASISRPAVVTTASRLQARRTPQNTEKGDRTKSTRSERNAAG